MPSDLAWTLSVDTMSPSSSETPRKRHSSLVSALLAYKHRGDEMPVTPHSFLTAGGWLIPGTSALCPPATPHPQFGGPLSLPSTHSCERYPTLRNHRPSPYPSPYTHRNNSPSKLYGEVAWGAGRPLLERDLLGSRGQDGRSPPEPTPKPGSFVAREEPCPVWATVGSIPERSCRETLDVECASVIAPAFLAQNCGQL